MPVPYYLPQHVYYCSSGSYAVFLDLHRDEYLAVDNELVDGLLAETSVHASEAPRSVHERDQDHRTKSVAADLIDRGLLTRSELNSRALAPVVVPPPRRTSLHAQPAIRNLVRFHSFNSACRAAARSLRTFPMRDTVAFVRRRKTLHRRCPPAPTARILSLTSTFNAVRLTFPHEYLCLFDSLALIEYLAAYKIFPSWIFGVQAEPFFAHCWVQYGDLLLNDSIENVTAFTPIMTV